MKMGQLKTHAGGKRQQIEPLHLSGRFSLGQSTREFDATVCDREPGLFDRQRQRGKLVAV